MVGRDFPDGRGHPNNEELYKILFFLLLSINLTMLIWYLLKSQIVQILQLFYTQKSKQALSGSELNV